LRLVPDALDPLETEIGSTKIHRTDPIDCSLRCFLAVLGPDRDDIPRTTVRSQLDPEPTAR
jgi:hypothetical protein